MINYRSRGSQQLGPHYVVGMGQTEAAVIFVLRCVVSNWAGPSSAELHVGYGKGDRAALQGRRWNGWHVRVSYCVLQDTVVFVMLMDETSSMLPTSAVLAGQLLAAHARPLPSVQSSSMLDCKTLPSRPVAPELTGLQALQCGRRAGASSTRMRSAYTVSSLRS